MMAELVLTNWYPASQDALYRWWTDADRLSRWFAPAGSRVVSATAQAVPGGAWQVVFVGEGGRVTEHGRYLDLSPPNGLRMSLQQDFDDGRRGPETEIDVTLESEGEGTRLHFVQRGVDPDAVEGMTEGWQSCLDQIASGLRAEAAAA